MQLLLDGQPIIGAAIVRAEIQSDLVPVPFTLELSLKDTPDLRARLKQDSLIEAGRDADRFRIVKAGLSSSGDALKTDDSSNSIIRVTALLAGCYRLAEPLQRAIIKEQTSFGAIYRACGAETPVADDVPVKRFYCFRGMVSSFGIAARLQETAAAVVYRRGKIGFMRLRTLAAQDPIAEFADDAGQAFESRFSEKAAVPFGFSTLPDGSFVSGKVESGRVAVHWPSSDAQTLGNLSTALIRRRVIQTDYAEGLRAGDVVRCGSKNYLIETAAHVWSGAVTGTPQMATKLWLGEVVQ